MTTIGMAQTRARVVGRPFYLVMSLVMFGVISLFAFAGPVFDLIVRRRVHRAYWWGAAAILLSDVAIGPLAFSPLGAMMLQAVRAG